LDESDFHRYAQLISQDSATGPFGAGKATYVNQMNIVNEYQSERENQSSSNIVSGQASEAKVGGEVSNFGRLLQEE